MVPPAPTIRSARAEDCAAMCSIYNHYVRTDTCTYRGEAEPETVAERQAWLAAHDAQHPVLVAEEAGQVIGWASLSHFNPRSGYRFTVEDSVYLAPEARGRGLGSALLAELIRQAEALGHHAIIAAVSAEQSASVALHTRFGFTPVGRLPEVGHKFDRWLDLVYLQLSLPRPALRPPPAADLVRLDGPALAAATDALAELLIDAVEGGASVGFLRPLAPADARAYWADVADAVAAGRVLVLAARRAGRVVGTVQLALEGRSNGRHRAEVAKLLVHRTARRAGLGHALMRRIEDEARALGRTLLVLDTETDSPAERLYRALGWQVAGTIPGYAAAAGGEGLHATTVMWRHL